MIPVTTTKNSIVKETVEAFAKDGKVERILCVSTSEGTYTVVHLDDVTKRKLFVTTRRNRKTPRLFHTRKALDGFLQNLTLLSPITFPIELKFDVQTPPQLPPE